MAESPLARDFGALVRELRSEKGYSQEEFAHRSGLHRTYMGFIERGERNVTIVTAAKIAGALGTDLAGLFSEMKRRAGPRRNARGV